MASAFNIEPYAFDRVFAGNVAEPANANFSDGDLALRVAALERELAHTRETHASELALARVDGFNAGLVQARTERDAAMLAAIDALHAGIEWLDSRLDDTVTALVADAAEVALAAADILAARALALSPCAAVDDAVGRVLRQVPRGQELTIRVNPSLVEEMERLVAVRQSQDRRRLNLTVCADAGLAVGDALIVWDEGGLTLDATLRRAMLVKELDGLLPAG